MRTKSLSIASITLALLMGCGNDPSKPAPRPDPGTLIPEGSFRSETGNGFYDNRTNEAILFLHNKGWGHFADQAKSISFNHIDDFDNRNAIYIVGFGEIPTYGNLYVYTDAFGTRVATDYQLEILSGDRSGNAGIGTRIK